MASLADAPPSRLVPFGDIGGILPVPRARPEETLTAGRALRLSNLPRVRYQGPLTRGNPGRFSPKKKKRKPLDLAKLAKRAYDFRYRSFDQQISKGKPFYSDPIAEQARIATLNSLDWLFLLAEARGVARGAGPRVRGSGSAPGWRANQKGFVAPKGVKPPPAAPSKLAKPAAPVWKPPPPPPRPPKRPTTDNPMFSGKPATSSKATVRPWEGAARAPSYVKTGRDLADAVGIQKRVSVGKGLSVALPPQSQRARVEKLQRDLTRAARAPTKTQFGKARGVRKTSTAGKTSLAKRLAKFVAPRDFFTPDLLRELLRPAKKAKLQLPKDVKEPNDFGVTPSTPELARRDLTALRTQEVGSKPKSCECPDVKTKKPRRQCRQGYFRENARGITYKTWSTRKCP